MKKFVEPFLLALLSGVCVGTGGILSLSVEDPIISALYFTIGLFIICVNQFHLFTGRVGYVLDHPPSYIGWLFITWLGNFAGTAIIAYGMKLTRIANLSERAAIVCQEKLSDVLLSSFLLAIPCGFLMFIAVHNFNHNPHHGAKYLGLFLCVSGFILCGFEHCVADMFYFSAGDAWSLRTFMYLLAITLGNSVGGFFVPGVWKIGKHFSVTKTRSD